MLNGFTVESESHRKIALPIEDSFSLDKEKLVLAVADGVTRDPSLILPEAKEQFAKTYPKPSPAEIIADIFTKTFIKRADYSEESVRKAFEAANLETKRWNDKHIPHPDYVLNDLAGCVASGALVKDGKFFYGFLCDCGVAVLDKNGKLKFRTQDEGPSRHDKYFWEIIKSQLEKEANWNMPEARKIVRSHFRNNPQAPHSFGVLTGEENAMHYVRTGSGLLLPGDLLLVYSDGLDSIIFTEDFAKKVKARDFKGMKKLCQERVRTEGTLTYYSN